MAAITFYHPQSAAQAVESVDQMKKLAGIKPKYTEFTEALQGEATPKQVSYAMALAKKATHYWLPIAQQFGLGSVPDEAELTKMSKQKISELIDALKHPSSTQFAKAAPIVTGANVHVSNVTVTQGYGHKPPPHEMPNLVPKNPTSKATTAQVQYALNMMAEIGRKHWVQKGLDKKFPKVKLADLKAMTKGEISELIGNLKVAAAGF